MLVFVGQPKTISAEEAAAVVHSGDWVDYGFGLGQPDLFDRALAARVGDLRDVRIRSAGSLHPRAVVEADPTGASFRFFSWHFLGWDRKQHDAGMRKFVQ